MALQLLHQLNEIIDEVKDNIPNGEYVNIMGKIRKIYKYFVGGDEEEDDEPMSLIELRCECVEDRLTCNRPLLFNVCRYKYEILESIPFLAFILNDFFEAQINLPDVKLQMEPIYKNDNEKKTFNLLRFLFEFTENISGRNNKTIIVICIFHLIFQNFNIAVNNPRFKETLTKKLEEFSNEINIDWEEVNLTRFRINENPFKVWLNYLKN